MNRPPPTATPASAPLLLSEAQRDWLLLAASLAPQATALAAAADEEAAVRLLEAALRPSEVARFGEAVQAEESRDGRTTVMMRKIPRRLTHEELLTLLDRQTPGLEGQVEFLYLPRDVARRSNRGFCFVNFHSPRGVGRLASLLDRQSTTALLPEPLAKCQLFYANVQGRGEELRGLIEQRQSLVHHSRR